MDRAFAKSIRRNIPGIGSRVDAAFENYGEGNIKTPTLY